MYLNLLGGKSYLKKPSWKHFQQFKKYAFNSVHWGTPVTPANWEAEPGE